MAYSGTVTTNTLPLRIRSGPSTSNKIVGRMPKGAKITITEVINKGDWTWGKVTYNGVSGYCCIKEPGVGTWVKLEKQENKPTPKKPEKPKKKKKDTNVIAETNTKNPKVVQTLAADATIGINGSAVQYESGKYGTSGYSDVNDVSMVDPLTGLYKAGAGTNDYNAPKFMQNAMNFPPVAGVNTDGMYTYDYYMDYSDMKSEFDTIYQNNNIGIRSRRESYLASANYYNRFKMPMIDNVLSRSYAHVFFIRPDLNILKPMGSGVYELADTVKNNPNFYYAKEHSVEILKELVHDTYEHDFSFMLSSAARSFELSDQYIKSETYGDAYTGHKIAFGKHDAESKASGTFNITYNDDRDLHIMQLHHIWTNYISSVYRGEIKAMDKYIRKKILDYASAVYYILTAEDGETILFWSKYYGVFPTNLPSSQFSYSKGNLVNNPEITISYSYSFKEDYNPLTLVEFNSHSPKEELYRYQKSYSKTLLGTGKTLVGAPFIETFNDGMHDPYTFKLRFR